MNDLSAFHFIRPYSLLLLIPYAVLSIQLLRNKKNQGNWSTICDSALLPYLLQHQSLASNRWPSIAIALTSLLAIFALAGPTWQRLPAPVFRNESALVIALDLSASMNAADTKPNRLVRARYKIADLLNHRKDGQTALLVFAGDAFTVTPLTNDVDTIENQLNALTTELMPIQGNLAQPALAKAVDLLKQAGLQQGHILFVTDGVEFNKSEVSTKLSSNYQLSVLAVGSKEGAPISLPEGGFLKDSQGSIVVSQLEESNLNKLVELGHGIYQPTTVDDTDIQHLLATIDKAEKQQGKASNDLQLEQWSDQGPWLLLLVLPVMALTFRKGFLCVALLLLSYPLPKTSYALDWQDLWHSKDQQAQQAYNQGNFTKAAELFSDPDWKAAAQYRAGQYDQSLESLKNSQTSSNAYNRGNALAQAGQLEAALKSYDEALARNPSDSDAQYNRDIVKKALNQQKQNQNQDKQEDKPTESDSKNTEPEQSADQQSNDGKPEQKTEQKASDQQQSANDQQSTETGNDAPKDTNNLKAQNQQNSEPADNDAKDHTQETTTPSLSTHDKDTKEQQQANEQWLKRIPDDPAGLLRRKFKYQYGQRKSAGNY